MVYPVNFEQKTGFDKIRARLKALCLSYLGIQKVDKLAFSTEYTSVLKQLNCTGEMKTICLTEDVFPVNYYFDLTQVLHHLKIEGTFPEVEELFNMYRSLETIKAIFSFFKDKNKNKYPSLWEIAGSMQVYPFVFNRIGEIITNQGKIKNSASAELASIRREINTKQSEVTRCIQRIMKHAQTEGWADTDTSPSVREGRLVIPVNAMNKRRIKGFVHDESATGKTCYIEPAEVVELNNDLRELEFAERREIVRILTSFANDIRPYIDDLLLTYNFLGEIDFLRAKALFAIEINAVNPPLSGEPVIEWISAIHPLLLLHLKAENKEIAPLNIKLNKKQRILVISGPNAGGKSVCLQTVALLQYMLQCGMLIPLKETSETGIFSNIFLDIGDEQSIENDLSTYSSHLQNMKFFLRNANEKTLFLIDEFGTGTEPMIGGAIAESILQELNLLKTYGVVTTHYTNLKHFASSTEGIVNGAMLFDTHLLQPIFKLETGEPGSSFAFEIARKIGLPEAILKSATQKVGEEHIDFDRNLKEIIRDKLYWQQKRNSIKENEKRLDELVQRYSEDLKDINSLRKEILQKTNYEAQQLLSDVNKQIENTIRFIKEHNAEKEKTKEARKKIEELKEKVSSFNLKEEEQIANKIEQLKRREKRKQERRTEKAANIQEKDTIIETDKTITTGDKVKLHGQNAVGEVISVNGKNITIAFGSMVTSVDEKRIEKISHGEYRHHQKQAIKPEPKSNYSTSEKKLTFKNQIDVRGMRANEAIQKISEYMDDAIVVGTGEVKILHGKGNGVLRQLIRNYLKTIDNIASFGDEHVDFGGAGITVVKFR